jgi:predicted DNA-binding transcriptional regulator AlpA
VSKAQNERCIHFCTVRFVPRRALSREEAATYVGIGTTKFDQLVKERRMPKPFKIDGRVLWDIRRLDDALDDLVNASAQNPWDRVE